MDNEKWYVGAQNDALFIINKPPRGGTDDIAPKQDVRVIAKVYEKEDADLIVKAVNAYQEKK